MNNTIAGHAGRHNRTTPNRMHHKHSHSMPSLHDQHTEHGLNRYVNGGKMRKKQKRKRQQKKQQQQQKQRLPNLQRTGLNPRATHIPGTKGGGAAKDPTMMSNLSNSYDNRPKQNQQLQHNAPKHLSASLPKLTPQISMSFTMPPQKNARTMPPVPRQRRSQTTLAPQHVCPVCTQRFRRRITLEVHQKILHPWTVRMDGTIIPGPVKLPFECNECGKCFARKEQYFAHKKLHTGAQALCCRKCGKRMLVRRSENKHARVHVSTYPPFDCVCGRRFETNKALTEHLAHREHHRPFVCVCGHQFKQKVMIKVREDIRGQAMENMSEVGKRWNTLSFV